MDCKSIEQTVVIRPGVIVLLLFRQREGAVVSVIAQFRTLKMGVCTARQDQRNDSQATKNAAGSVNSGRQDMPHVN